MAVNLSNVNISLNEFQRISKGDYNAGEVKLAGENKLAKMNNHVATWWYSNNENISHQETIAIKQAFVRALSQNGVQEVDINAIRKELGLQPMDASDRDLYRRSIMPLKRQDIRKILDRYAATINAQNDQNGGDVHIRTSTELFNNPNGRGGVYAKARTAVNASLENPNRVVSVTDEIAHFHAVVMNTADYRYTDEAARSNILNMARAQLDKLMQTCDRRPSDEILATAALSLEGGQTISVPTGMTQKAFAERLENIIIRFQCEPSPDQEEIDLANSFRKMSGQEKQEFWTALEHDPAGGKKARSLAIQCLYERGVDDYATLSLANRLTKNEAIAFARSCVLIPLHDTPDQIRTSQLITSFAARQAAEAPDADKVYVPATSNTSYNRLVCNSLTRGHFFDGDFILPQHQELVDSTIATVRSRLGEAAIKADASVTAVIDDYVAAGLQPNDPEAVRLTADALRESYLGAALKKAAHTLVYKAAAKAIFAEGGDAHMVQVAVNGIKARHPELFQRLAAAGNPNEANQILAEFKDRIDDIARLCAKLRRMADGVKDLALYRIADKLDVSIDDVRAADIAVVNELCDNSAPRLAAKILKGETQLTTDAEYEAAFRQLADDATDVLLQKMEEVDGLAGRLGAVGVRALPVAAGVKVALMGINRLGDVDLAFLVAEAKKIKADALAARLNENAPIDQVFAAMKNISQQMKDLANRALAGVQGFDADLYNGIMEIITNVVVRSCDGLDRRLDAFVARQDVRAEIDTNRYDAGSNVSSINDFQFCLSNAELYQPAKWQARLSNAIRVSPQELAAFRAAGGDVRAVEAGYHKSEMPMLAKAFALCKAARPESAPYHVLEEVLNPHSDVRRLASYGGRFIENDAPVPGLPIPANPVIGDPILKEGDVRFTFRFPDGQTLFSVAGSGVDPKVIQNTNAIAQKIEKLCGSVHQKQLANVYYLRAQNGEMPNVCSGFMDQKVHCTEHTALKYSFSKDALTGDVKIAYSEPDGFPFKFHWTATVALDGTITTTKMIIEP